MKFADEYRNADAANALAREIARLATRRWSLMEVCGGQTHSIIRYGIDSLLPEGVRLIHGPGCPVCVTPSHKIDEAVRIAQIPGVILASFGDMMRVPGTRGDLLSARAAGGDVRMVYSPIDAVDIAEKNPDKTVVFFAVGFETTAPANATAVLIAQKRGLRNFTLLVSHVLVPPAIDALMSDPETRVNGFLAAGHVCAIMGDQEYGPLAAQYRVPIVITGFEPLDILDGVLRCVRMLEEGRWGVENAYARSVRSDGNPAAQETIRRVFRVATREWRGIGTIPQSGLELAEEFAAFDAERRYPRTEPAPVPPPSPCISGIILKGTKLPTDCPAFGRECTPEHPLGATMVSSEGACAAYYRYRRGGATP